jgi:alpha-galactosidase
MAAPAEMPEFQGNVVAIRTETYWDRELSLARAKENAVKQKAKAQKRKPAEERALVEKLRLETLSERERLVLEKGVSNLEFHYLGSAKILGGIGKGLAEAMAELRKSRP